MTSIYVLSIFEVASAWLINSSSPFLGGLRKIAPAGNMIMHWLTKTIFWSASKKKTKQEAYEKLIEMSRNDDYTTGNLWDYLYHQKYYKLIGIDLSWQTNTSIPQQINFVGKLEEYDGATLFLYFWKAAKNYFKLFFRFIHCNRII